jgi:hypothetical protein
MDRDEMRPPEASTLAEPRQNGRSTSTIAGRGHALAVVQWTYRWNLAEADKEFARALALNPS